MSMSMSTLAKSIETLVQNNIPASMILLFDEVWELCHVAGNLISQSTHQNNVINFDMLAWHIDASKDECGFSPHRDRQPDNVHNVKSSFHSNGHAKYVTLWLALTDATPENSCLYVIPQQYDPGYLEGDDDNDDGDGDDDELSLLDKDTKVFKDPLQKALTSKTDYQNIRAIPRLSGQAVMFTHRILHWGSKGNPQCKHPRVALSFVSSDPSFEKPYLSPKYYNYNYNYNYQKNENASDDHAFNLPPFHIRLLLVCAQLLIYYQRLNLDTATIRACYDYCKQYQHILEENYRKKVFVEFVKAMKEARSNTHLDEAKTLEKNSFFHPETKTKTNTKINTNTNTKTLPDQGHSAKDNGCKNGHTEEDEDKDEDAMLEAMLDAEEAGCDDFEDDYDDEFQEDDNFGEDSEDDDDEEQDTETFFGKNYSSKKHEITVANSTEKKRIKK